MDPSHENPRESIRQAIDAEIRLLEGSIRELRHLNRRRNAFAPISSLPPEVFTTIFALFRPHITPVASTLGRNRDQPDPLSWLLVAHVCHQWREIALNQPLFWSHINFTAFSSAGVAEILARAKEVPLNLEARARTRYYWNDARLSAFQKVLQDRVSHICQLGITMEPSHLNRTLEGLMSPALTLEYLSLFSLERRSRNRTEEHVVVIPDTLFNGSAPKLSSIELWNCEISWKSPLLEGLKHLEIRSPFERPILSVWLDALAEMPQLKTLTLHFASPITPPGTSLRSDVERTVTLPSLTLFEISAPAIDCGLALAHLVLPALASLCLILSSRHVDGDDVQNILPFIVRHAHGPQDTQPLHSMLFSNTKILAWPLPDMDAEFAEEISFFDAMHTARVAFTVANKDWSPGAETKVFDAVMAALPLGNLVTLTAQNCTRTFDEQFWLRHVPRWPLLRSVRLWPSAARGFREMMKDKGGHESPLLPSLTKIVLIKTALLARRTLHLRDALRKRAEKGFPLEMLDLRRCLGDSRSVEPLSDVVAEVLGPEETLETISHGFHPEDSPGTED
jgi:hypothetical protein